MKIKSILVGALAAVTLVSCAKNDDGGGAPVAGKPTYMHVAFTIPNESVTKATDTNATEEESKITNVTVFIYDHASGNYVGGQTLALDKFNLTDGNKYSSINKIPTTTGQKKVLIGANLSAADIAAMQVGYGIAEKVVSGGAYSTSQPMFCRKVAEPTFVTDDDATAGVANKVTMSIERRYAKLTVEKSAGNYAVINGKATDVTFGYRNMMTSAYIMRNVTAVPAGETADEWNAVTQSYLHENQVAGDLVHSVYPTGYKAIAESGTAVTSLPSLYLVESTRTTPSEALNTYVSIAAKFIPQYVYKKEGTEWVSKENANYAPGTYATFYGVIYNGARYYFNTLAEAKEFGTAKGLDLETADAAKLLSYTDGICYYSYYLNKTRGYNVYRNDYYRVSVARILGPGNPTPEPVDPGELESPTNIDIEIDVLPWNIVADETDLRP